MRNVHGVWKEHLLSQRPEWLRKGSVPTRATLAFLLAVLTLAASSQSASAQISTPPINRERGEDGELIYKNSLGVGFSGGLPYDRDAYFWGATVNYTRLLESPWSVTASIAFDQERDRPEGRPVKTVNTFTGVATVDYSFLRWLTVSTGIGKGFASDDKGSLRFEDGDWSTGVAFGISLPGLPFTPRDSVSLSLAWEWNITESDPSVSTDIAFGWSF